MISAVLGEGVGMGAMRRYGMSLRGSGLSLQEGSKQLPDNLAKLHLAWMTVLNPGQSFLQIPRRGHTTTDETTGTGAGLDQSMQRQGKFGTRIASIKPAREKQMRPKPDRERDLTPYKMSTVRNCAVAIQRLSRARVLINQTKFRRVAFGERPAKCAFNRHRSHQHQPQTIRQLCKV